VRQGSWRDPTGGSPVRVRPSEPPDNECCRHRGNAGSEAYTVTAWGVGLSRGAPGDRQEVEGAGITKACFYEPTVNRTYADMAAHYRTVIIPARPYKPRDKAKVEVGVQVVQRWILARLRNRRFFSLAELNRAIRELVDQLNDRPMRGWGSVICIARGRVG
jgi:hypothetical protein